MHKSKMSKLVNTFNSYWIYDGYMSIYVYGYIIYRWMGL